MSETQINETPGRTLPHEPIPYLSIDRVYCGWADKRITVNEARDIYNPTSEYCSKCNDCQERQ